MNTPFCDGGHFNGESGALRLSMVNGSLTPRSTAMTTALKYLSRVTEEIFASQMQIAAQRICERQHIFQRRVG
jgi:hypothetical protein